MGFNLQRITQIMMQEFSTVNLLHLVKGHWKNNKPGIGSSKDKFFGFMKVNDHMVLCSPSFNVIEFIYKISIRVRYGTNKLVSSACLRRIHTGHST